MSNWIEGRVLENRAWTETLFSLRVKAKALSFDAGQFVRIALDVERGNAGSRIARPFSFVNAPDDPVLEFDGVIVPGGRLSPLLARLQTGDGLFIADNPSGFLVLAEVPPAEDLWLLATGTGIAPYLSILRTEVPWKSYRNVILVHAVRNASELVYKEMILQIQKTKKQLKYVSFVSREAHSGSLSGRIPAAIRDGRLEAAAGVTIAPERSQFMLCGNPAMLKDAAAELAARGLRKNRRRAPGHITVESFW
jgi:ferredoxin--NADP+ reductase